ncbi:MAG: hypothetical protein KH269_05565 [Faecalibacterium prausnitzii]|nr:hypothetical protein [Faecalibacterium prausnitzii]
MLETSTVSGFNPASILSLGHLQINVKLHLSGDPIRDFHFLLNGSNKKDPRSV